MSATKGALKAAKIAIDAHNYEDAEKQARSVLETDPKHYTATVFLGLALDKQGKVEEAEKVYKFAKEIKPGEILALQGLLSVYEQQAARRVDDYSFVARQIAEHQAEAEDLHKCQTVVDKYVSFAKQHGSKTQYKTALEFILPNSPVYEFLEGRLPHPANTYPKVIEITESEESLRINKLIGERRTRIGAKIGDVTTEVKLEVYDKSPLEILYQQAIDWTNDDDIRRLYEERLLQRAYDTLAVLPLDRKVPKREQVQKLAEGMIIIKHPFALAWNIVFEWRDHARIQDFDVTLLRAYIDLFSEDGLTKILEGYLESDFSPFPKLPKKPRKREENVEEDETEDEISLTPEDRLILMSEGLEQSARSITSQRFMAEYYLALEEHASVIGCSRKALELLNLEASKFDVRLQDSIDSVNVVLGTALVQHESPRNHSQARQLFEAILERKPTNTAALIGLGLILEEEAEYKQAIEFFERVLQRSPDVRIKSEAAWCRALEGDSQTGLRLLLECLDEYQSAEVGDRELLSLIHYRIGQTMWNLDTSKSARKDRQGPYAHFIASLKANVNYAPAYTSLGYFYADYGKDKSRARKCFQKAFELSISEVDAAQRLARLFADQKDWELVEAVSQRVVESGKVRPPPGSKKKGISWPFAALGVCQLNGQEYAKSITSFQAALRISPDDFHSWIGLGESYHNLGRYVAATKAFEHALGLQIKDGDIESVWYSRYMLANVKRELGDFEDAIKCYNEVLENKPQELGVLIALLQTYAENAWSCICTGFFGRAVDNCILAIQIAAEVTRLKPQTFNLWKALGDICTVFTWAESYSDKFPADDLVAILSLEADSSTYQYLKDVDQIDWETIPTLTKSQQTKRSSPAVTAAILCHKRAINCAANDVHAQAVAWYNLGWTEYRASSTIATSPKHGNQLLKAAVQSFKRAIELESGNAEFWDALGIVTTKLNPKVSQHAFVRSLHLNDRSAKTWTNLGTLYLLQNDFQLANEAFTRGQSSDPEYADAWLGQGVLALMGGDLREAQALFTHAFEIADATSLITKQLYASSSFDQLLLSKTSADISELLQPLFALHQLRSQKQGDEVYNHLSALISERIGQHEQSIEVLEEICARLEEEYESSESTTTLSQFAQSKADLARVYLAAGQLPDAIETAETALDLSAEEETGTSDPIARTKYRLSAHLTAGLAHSSNGNISTAIMMFREALKESQSDPDIIVTLSQVLWAKGGEKEQNVVREQLFDCIEKNPSHAGAITLLAVVAVLDEDHDTLDAVMADLLSLRTREDIDEQQKLRLTHLLAAVNLSLDAGDTKSGSVMPQAASSAVTIMLDPSSTHGWSQLADSTDDTFPAEIALLAAKGSVPPRGALDAEDLAIAITGTGIPADAQRGIMFAPWLKYSWSLLARTDRP